MSSAATSELGSGLRVRRLQKDGAGSLTAMLAFDAGGRAERADEDGIAHFLEHLVFKGGEGHPTHRDVNFATDRLGARLNAFTGDELVAFHVRARAERAAEAIDLLTDIVGRPVMDPAELESERGVVIQEIARQQDQPAARALDLSGPATFGEHPLGRPILGTEESVGSFDADEVLAFRARRWGGGGAVALLVGNGSAIDQDRLEELLARLPGGAAPEPVEPAPPFEPRTLVEERDSRQSHVVLAYRPEIDTSDPRARAAFSVHAMALGGSMGSRLVTEIREERGWAYSIRAEPDALRDAAVLYVRAGLDSAHAAAAVERTREIVAEVAAELPEDDFERARSSAAGRRALSFENTTTAASHLAEEEIVHGRQTDPASLVAELDEVGFEEVRAIAAAVAAGDRCSIACVGPHAPDEFA